MTTYNIDRNTAARLLNVSVRTVDRYLQTGKLESIRADGRIWLSKEEILDTLRQKEGLTRQSRQDKERQYVKTDNLTKNTDSLSTNANEYIDTRQSFARHNPPENVWREPQTNKNTTNSQPEQTKSAGLNLENLYKEMQEVLAIKDKRLAQASYKIGQLEAQISNMIPRAEIENQQKLLTSRVENYELQIIAKDHEIIELKETFHAEIEKKEREKSELNEIRVLELSEKERFIKKLDEDLYLEKVNKWIHAIILYIFVVALIAIWMVTKFL